MNSNLLFGISAFVAFAILLSVNFGSIYNYYAYTVPIKNAIDIDPEFPGDMHYERVPNENHAFYASIRNITPLDDGSIDVDFGNTDYRWSTGYDPIPEFSHSQNIKVNQTFVVICHDPANPLYRDLFKNSTLEARPGVEVLKYLGPVDVLGTKSFKFYHVQRTIQSDMPCSYPEVIKYSIDAVKLKVPEQFDKEHDLRYGAR